MARRVHVVNASTTRMIKMMIAALNEPLADLKAGVAQWIRAGEQVVVMLDVNSDVQDGEVNQTFSALGVRKVLLEPNADLPSTSAFARNLKDVQIDAIFAMPSATLEAGGHFGFGKGPGLGHSCLWMDISHQTAFGCSPVPWAKSRIAS